MNGSPDRSGRATLPGPTLDLTNCPACGAPAEIVRRFVLESTDGPVEHARVRCVDREWFVVPIAILEAAAAR